MRATYSNPMVVRSAVSGEVLRVNREFTERLGLGADELDEFPLLDWIHADDRTALEETLTLGEGRARARHRDSAGRWLPFEWRVSTHAGGVVALGLCGGQNEVAAERPTPNALPPPPTMGDTLDAMARVVEAKNPGMRCSILLVDPERRIITGGAGPSLPPEYNRAVEGLHIGPAVGSCGTAAFWNVPVVVEDISRDPLWRDLREAAAVAGVSACWSQPVTMTGGEVLGAMALYDPRPRRPAPEQMNGLEIAARMVGLAVERNRLEEQLRQATKMEAVGVLAGGIAHDFNNLLAVILGNTELALSVLPEDAEAAPMLREVVTANASAAELCNQLLAYAGRGVLSKETVECNTLIREIGGLLHVTLSKKAQLAFDLHPAPLCLVADRGQLRQVIMNLITNAAEAVGDVDGRVVISTSAATYTREQLERVAPDSGLEPGDYARLRVSDTGVGMSSATEARIFDPFFTTKPSGRGLGLAAVRGIVSGLRGVISVTSTPGVGTEFTVLLPRVPAPCNDAAAGAESEPEARAGHVLVVDDEPAVRMPLAGMLERAGFSVTQAGDGLEAIHLFRDRPDAVDCVLLDLSMPKLSGEEVFHEMRKLRDNLPVVLISGYTEQEIMERFEGAGLVGAVQKPAPMKVLLSKVNAAIGKADA